MASTKSKESIKLQDILQAEDLVLAMYKGTRKLYPATVAEVGDEELKIEWHDGDKDNTVKKLDEVGFCLRPPTDPAEYKVGDAVQAYDHDTGDHYDATVINLLDNCEVRIRWKSGGTEVDINTCFLRPAKVNPKMFRYQAGQEVRALDFTSLLFLNAKITKVWDMDHVEIVWSESRVKKQIFPRIIRHSSHLRSLEHNNDEDDSDGSAEIVPLQSKGKASKGRASSTSISRNEPDLNMPGDGKATKALQTMQQKLDEAEKTIAELRRRVNDLEDRDDRAVEAIRAVADELDEGRQSKRRCA